MTEEQELRAAMAPPVPVIDFDEKRVNAPAIVLSRLAFYAVRAAIDAPPRVQTKTAGIDATTVASIRNALDAIGFDWKDACETERRTARIRASNAKRRVARRAK